MRYYIGPFICIFVLFLGGPFVVAAQSASESFTIDTRYGDNTDPPTVPDPVTATSISDAQIDIEWGASSNPFGVAGYQVFRDGVQIDTVTETTYSDIGLQASTTYAYFIRAFDIDGLVSSSSATATATTFPPAPDPHAPLDIYQVGRAPEPTLNAYELVTGANSARLTFQTSVPTWYSLQYGRSENFGAGVVQTEVLRSEHTTLLTDLEPSTTYEYELQVTDRYNQTVLVRRASFTTEPRFRTQTSNNVQGLRADVINDDVLLRWRNPDIDMFSHVRVVRNHRFFPLNPWDGHVVYEGVGQVHIDSEAMVEWPRQYYTVFAFDLSGNFSSGAVVTADKIQEESDPMFDPRPDVQPPAPPTPAVPATPTPTTTDSESVSNPEALDFRFTDIEFIQNDERFVPVTDRVELLLQAPFLLRVPVAVVPPHLKIMTVTITRPEGRPHQDTYLLRRNSEETYYEAMIDQLDAPGDYQLLLSIYDLQEEVQYQVSGTIEAVAPATGVVEDTEPWYILFGYWFIGLLGLIFIVLWIWRSLLFFRRPS